MGKSIFPMNYSKWFVTSENNLRITKNNPILSNDFVAGAIMLRIIPFWKYFCLESLPIYFLFCRRNGRLYRFLCGILSIISTFWLVPVLTFQWALQVMRKPVPSSKYLRKFEDSVLCRTKRCISSFISSVLIICTRILCIFHVTHDMFDFTDIFLRVP